MEINAREGFGRAPLDVWNMQCDDEEDSQDRVVAAHAEADALFAVPRCAGDTVPLWMREPGDVPAEEYAGFYRTLTHGNANYLCMKHLHEDDQLKFRALLFVPGQYVPQYSEVKSDRTFVLGSGGGLSPKWLNFVVGVVDFEDLPPSITRKALLTRMTVRVIRRWLTDK